MRSGPLGGLALRCECFSLAFSRWRLFLLRTKLGPCLLMSRSKLESELEGKEGHGQNALLDPEGWGESEWQDACPQL